MAEYRYLACDLRTDQLITELPLVDVSYGGAINDIGPFNGRVRLGQSGRDDDGVLVSWDSTLVAGTQPGKTVVYVERDEVLIDAYIIWTRAYDSATDEVMIGGASLASFFKHQHILQTQEYLLDDQLDIARALINYAQSQVGADLNIQTETNLSGVFRQRTYWHYEFKQVFEAIKQLAEVENGFEFAFDVAYDAGVRTRTFRLSYPNRGRLAQDTGHIFEIGRNVVSYQLEENFTDAAVAGYAIGAGEGESMVQSSYARTDRIDAGWPLLQTTVTHKDISNKSTLDEKIIAEVESKFEGRRLVDLTVRGDLTPQIGEWTVGDWCRIADPGAHLAAFYPDGLDEYRRIVGYFCTPGNNGQETVRLILN